MTKIISFGSEKLQQASFALGRKILDSGFIPTHIIAVWRGGSFIAMCVHEFLKTHGVAASLVPVPVQRYDGSARGRLRDTISADLQLLEGVLDPDSRLLIVDDIFDTGLSVQQLMSELRSRFSVAEIRVAAVHYSSRNKTNPLIEPDYFVEKVVGDVWINYPHELVGLTVGQVSDMHGKEIARMIDPERFENKNPQPGEDRA